MIISSFSFHSLLRLECLVLRSSRSAFFRRRCRWSRPRLDGVHAGLLVIRKHAVLDGLEVVVRSIGVYRLCLAVTRRQTRAVRCLGARCLVRRGAFRVHDIKA